jgi:predicted DNA-binding protein (UPF0251 family)
MNHKTYNVSTEPKTKEQLAQEMNISFSTFQRRLKKAGLKIPRGLSLLISKKPFIKNLAGQ